jgi:hypothetical protein
LPPTRGAWFGAIALLATLPAVAGSPISVVLIDLETAFHGDKFDYVVPGYGGSTQGHWHDLNGSVLTLRLPDGRLLVVNCPLYSHGMELTRPAFGQNQVTTCFVPVESTGEITAVITARKVELTWSDDRKPGRPLHATFNLLGIFEPK